MFDPEWDKGCSGCTGYVDALGDLSMLNDRDTTFVLVSRAPLAKRPAGGLWGLAVRVATKADLRVGATTGCSMGIDLDFWTSTYQAIDDSDEFNRTSFHKVTKLG